MNVWTELINDSYKRNYKLIKTANIIINNNFNNNRWQLIIFVKFYFIARIILNYF